MGLFSFSSSSKPIHSEELGWEDLTSVEQLEEVFATSNPAVYFKHSTRCSISKAALNRFEREWKKTDDCKIYFIDLLAHRDVSNRLAELTQVIHQSPQAILVKNHEVVYKNSHNGISAEDIHNLI